MRHIPLSVPEINAHRAAEQYGNPGNAVRSATGIGYGRIGLLHPGYQLHR